jgi:GTP-binding protein
MSARFVASATTPDKLPDLGLVEIAFAGRSNVGKSSLLGAVLGDPKLVRTSRTPGRTQGLNLFVRSGDLALVDLPGYGFAKLAKEKRAELERMLRAYFDARASLAGVVLLVDARREEVSELDRAFADWVIERARRLLVTVTKIDLVPKNRRKHVMRLIEDGLGIPQGSSLACSAHEGIGVKELLSSLYQLRTEVLAGGEGP